MHDHFSFLGHFEGISAVLVALDLMDFIHIGNFKFFQYNFESCILQLSVSVIELDKSLSNNDLDGSYKYNDSQRITKCSNDIYREQGLTFVLSKIENRKLQ